LKANPFNWFPQTETSSSTSTQVEAVGQSLKDMMDHALNDYAREVNPAASHGDFDATLVGSACSEVSTVVTYCQAGIRNSSLVC